MWEKWRSKYVCVGKYFTYWVISPAKTSTSAFFKNHINVYGWINRLTNISFKNNLILSCTVYMLGMCVWMNAGPEKARRIRSLELEFQVVRSLQLGSGNWAWVLCETLHAVKCLALSRAPHFLLTHQTLDLQGKESKINVFDVCEEMSMSELIARGRDSEITLNQIYLL